MANSSTQGNVTQSSGHTHTATNTALKYRSTNSGQPLAHADVDDNFEILRKAINGVVADIDAVVKTDVPTGAVFTDTTYVAVTDTVSGLMTGAMKQKLDGIASGAEVNVQADWNATTGDAQILNKPNIAYTSAIPVATQSASGLMSVADKTKLDGIESGATAGGGTGGGASVTTDPTAPSNPSDGDLWFNENEAELYVYTASLGAWIQTNGGGGSGGGETYESAETAIPVTNTTQEWTHGLGQTPTHISLSLRCKTAEYGYDVGDEITFSSEYTYGIASYTFWANSTKIGFRSYIAAGPTPFTIVKRDVVNAVVNPTANNWKVVVRASVGVGGGGGASTYQRWSTDGNWRGGAIVLDDQYHGSHWYEESDIHSITATDINTGQHLGQVGPPDRGYYMPNPSLTNGGNWGVSGSATSYPFNDLHAAWMSPEIFNVTNNDGTHKDLSSSIDVLWIGGSGNEYGYLQTFNRSSKTSTWQTLGDVGGGDVFDLVATIPTNNAWPDLLVAQYYTAGNTDNYTNAIRLRRLTFDNTNTRYNGSNSTDTSRYLNLNATSTASGISLNFRESLGAGNDSFAGTDRQANHTDTVRTFGQVMGLNQWDGHLYINLMQRSNGIAVFKLSSSLTGTTWAEKLFNAGDTTSGNNGSMSNITYHGTYAYPAIGYSQGNHTATRKRIIWDFDNKRANGVSIINGDVNIDTGWAQTGGFEIVPWQDNWLR